MTKKKILNKNGFTLIEMMVAVSLFAVVMIIVIGALLSVNNANKKAQAMRAVVDNLNYSIEDMTRRIRTGTDYYCNVMDLLSLPPRMKQTPTEKECPNQPSLSIRILGQMEGDNRNYCYVYYIAPKDDSVGPKTIWKIRSRALVTFSGDVPRCPSPSLSDQWGPAIQTISPEIDVNSLNFRVVGTGGSVGIGATLQPIVIVNIGGSFNVDQGNTKLSSPFSLQTTISQRSSIQ